MKKRSLKKIMMAAAIFVMLLGVSVTASAFSKEASITSATDSQWDYDLTDQFGKYSEEEQKKFIAYYDCVDEWDIALDSYATGTLDLSKTGASAENPVTITFSLVEQDQGYGYVKAGHSWLYVMQQLEDGSCKLIPAQSSADRTITAQFTDAGESKIFIVGLDLAREGIDSEYWEVADKTPSADGVQSAVDAAGNPVNVTVTFTSLSPVAFVRTGEAAVPETEAAPTTAPATETTSAADGTNTRNIPKTGDGNALLVVLLGMLCAASAGTFVYVNKKRTA